MQKHTHNSRITKESGYSGKNSRCLVFRATALGMYYFWMLKPTLLLLFLLSLSMLTPPPAHAKDGHKQLLINYDKDGEKIKIYSWHHGGNSIVMLTLVNYKREYDVIYPIIDGNVLVWLTQVDFLSQNDFDKIGCTYKAVNDTTNNIISTTSLRAKYNSDSLKGASRIYLTQLEKDLLKQAIQLRIAAGPEEPEYYDNPVDPNSILFFICVPLGLHSIVHQNEFH